MQVKVDAIVKLAPNVNPELLIEAIMKLQ